MGIKGLWDYLKKHCPHVFETVPHDSFRGFRIAVDAHNLAYKTRSVTYKRMVFARDVISQPLLDEEVDPEWLKDLLSYVSDFLRAGITPVIVYDGEAPPEKEISRAKTRAEKEKVRAELDQLLLTRATDIMMIDKAVLRKVQELTCRLMHISKNTIELSKEFLRGIGIPVVEATGEGEKTCTMLTREGVTAATFSPDGDNLAMGCPILIRDKGDQIYDARGFGHHTYDIVRMEPILQALNVDQFFFTEWCIMSGTDFNENIPQIAVAKSFTRLQRARTIDALACELDIRCLNHVRTREILQACPASSIIKPGASFDIRPWDETVLDHLRSYQMDHYIDLLRTAIRTVPPARNFRHGSCTPISGLLIVEDNTDTLEGIVATPVASKSEGKGAKSQGRGRGRGRGKGKNKETSTPAPSLFPFPSYGAYTAPSAAPAPLLIVEDGDNNWQQMAAPNRAYFFPMGPAQPSSFTGPSFEVSDGMNWRTGPSVVPLTSRSVELLTSLPIPSTPIYSVPYQPLPPPGYFPQPQ